MKPGAIIYFLFAWSICSTFYSCSSQKSEEKRESVEADPVHSIIGKWDARWQMSGSDVTEFEDYQKRMEGKLKFSNNGEVEITTYGFDGCLFMPDTSTNTMNWKLEDKILRFIDKDDVHGIPYVVEEMENDNIRLSLMGDIQLMLSR